MMGIFNTLFGKKTAPATQARLVNLFTPYFSSSVNPKLNETFMSCVRLNAKHFGKILPRVYRKNEVVRPELNDILCVKPNPINEASSFWERFAWNYYFENNAFIYLDWDPYNVKMPLRSMWVLNPENMEVFLEKETKKFYISFILQGEKHNSDLENIVHVARDVDATEIFGARSPAINQVLSVISTNYEGIENAIKTSGFLRFILKANTVMKDADKTKKAKEFADTYLSTNSNGVAMTDPNVEFKEIVNPQPKILLSDDLKVLEEKIMKYHNVSNSMLLGSFTEDEYQAYYETNIEPLIVKLQNALTIKLLTVRERELGNAVRIAGSSLDVASLKTRTTLIQFTKDIGMFTINEYRTMLGYAPVEGGDNRLVSLNYINSEKADEYQMTKMKKENDNGSGTQSKT